MNFWEGIPVPESWKLETTYHRVKGDLNSSEVLYLLTAMMQRDLWFPEDKFMALYTHDRQMYLFNLSMRKKWVKRTGRAILSKRA